MTEQRPVSTTVSASLLPDASVEAEVSGEPAAVAASARQSLSPAFNRLWVAAIASNLADGVGRVAIPLLAATLTRDPAAIALLGALAIVPWLLFGVASGVIVDTIDRRKAMAAANAVRLLAALGLGALVVTDKTSLLWLGIVTVVFGAGEALFDNATNAVLPGIVRQELRDKANSRIQAAQVAIDLFVATPIGSALFAIAALVPLAVAGGGYGIAAALALALPAIAGRALKASASRETPESPEVETRRTGGTVGRDDSSQPVKARDGISYLWSHSYLRSMTLMTSVEAAFLTFAQATSLLLFLDHYDVPVAALGVVTAAVGVGGLGGSLLAPVVVGKWGRARVMFGATIIGGAGLLAVALSPWLWLAMVSYAIGAAGVSAWNVPWASVRQALIPDRLMGRVIGFARTIAWGLIPVASIAGGFVGRIDLQLSFAIGGAGSVLLALVCSRLILSTDAIVREQGIVRDKDPHEVQVLDSEPAPEFAQN